MFAQLRSPDQADLAEYSLIPSSLALFPAVFEPIAQVQALPQPAMCGQSHNLDLAEREAGLWSAAQVFHKSGLNLQRLLCKAARMRGHGLLGRKMIGSWGHGVSAGLRVVGC
jgi:hypothetical protein